MYPGNNGLFYPIHLPGYSRFRFRIFRFGYHFFETMLRKSERYLLFA